MRQLGLQLLHRRRVRTLLRAEEARGVIREPVEIVLPG
jgi:hypothetical protein